MSTAGQPPPKVPYNFQAETRDGPKKLQLVYAKTAASAEGRGKGSPLQLIASCMSLSGWALSTRRGASGVQFCTAGVH